jgi:hypothetical protein
MTIQLSDTVRSAMADAYETSIGTAPSIEFRTGAPPATCATAASGSLIATIVCPSDWMGAASAGVKTLLGSWTVAASGSGTIGHYRIKQGATCHEQGTVGTSGSDINLDNNAVLVGQVITITAKTFTQGGA